MDKREGESIDNYTNFRGCIINEGHDAYYDVKGMDQGHSYSLCAGFSTEVYSIGALHRALECHAWGYDGRGPQLLACNILAWYDHWLCPSNPYARARKYYKQFTTEVIANLPDEWELTGEEVARWVEKQEQQTKGKDNEPGETEKAAGPSQ